VDSESFRRPPGRPHRRKNKRLKRQKEGEVCKYAIGKMPTRWNRRSPPPSSAAFYDVIKTSPTYFRGRTEPGFKVWRGLAKITRNDEHEIQPAIDQKMASSPMSALALAKRSRQAVAAPHHDNDAQGRLIEVSSSIRLRNLPVSTDNVVLCLTGYSNSKTRARLIRYNKDPSADVTTSDGARSRRSTAFARQEPEAHFRDE